ncbi:MAG: deoxyguanosinetriphosphate triphosphohydrolase [Thermodesulfobacteriota bacterium]|nr:deoxyguanosinetriphosphate triphosphohydrolase [Thermodesulfobacteriota bacterium]
MEMDWNALLSPKRLNVEERDEVTESGRSVFHKDCDRITFSSSFRRLGKKTQVHPLASNDHIHTRLTHSVEVASVGRSLGINIGEQIQDRLPSHVVPANVGQIIQAACLAHDIGNPPFGHAGEEAIRNWFRQPKTALLLDDLEDYQKLDFHFFEGNAQGFRVVSQLEYYPCEGGMRLTYAALAALLKYPWTSRETTKVSKFSSFRTEESILNTIAEHVGLIKEDEFKYCRHPFAFLTEAADDICYRILDLEDAHEMGILLFPEILEILKPLCSKDPKLDNIIESTQISNRRKMSYLRGKAIGQAIDGVTNSFIDKLDDIMKGSFKNDLIYACEKEIKEPLDNAKEIAKEEIFKHPRKIELEIGAYTTLGILLETFCNAVREQVTGKTLSFRSERILSMMGINAPKRGDSLYYSYMQVMDYISGMTDSYATHMAKQIGGMAL